VKETLPRVDELFGDHPHDAMGAHAGMAGHPPMPGNDPQGPGPLPAGVADAMAKVERTPEMDKQLDQTLEKGDQLLTDGKWQEALDTFKQVMRCVPMAAWRSGWASRCASSASRPPSASS